ncbi:MAG TPA: hypothetical protein PKO28_03565 [Bacilli bacterium]|nr:hypothetical protein [Bacilli bacterium]HPS19202.1 hypothetical protein [Bacilli bacterium]
MNDAVKTSSKRKINFSAFANVVVFFTLEVLAFIAFSLGTSYILYSILSIVLLAFLLLVTFRQINKDGLATYAFFLFPIFVFGLLSALSVFTQDPAFALNGYGFFIPIAMTCFAACGYFVSSIKAFSISKAMLVIYSALAVLTLINLLATMLEFTPFYTLIYRGRYIFYDGAISEVPISQMAFALLGFSISEVSLEYFSLFPSLLITAIIPLFFLKFKQNKTVFSLYLGYTILGFIALLTTVSKMTIISDVLLFILVLLVLLFSKLHWKGKVLKIVAIVFASLFAIGFIVMFFNSLENGGGIFKIVHDFIAGNSLLNRIFTANGLVDKYNKILNQLLTTDTNGNFIWLFGFTATEVSPSNSWFFDNFMTSGVFGFFFFIFFLFVGVRRLLKYYRESSDNMKDKAMVVAFILCFFAYSFINYDASPLIFSKFLMPIYLSGPFLIALFLLSYAIYQSSSTAKAAVLSEPIAPEAKPTANKEGADENETISL